MAERRWEVPLDVAKEARRLTVTAEGVDAARLSDIAARMPVGRVTLLALIAAGVNGRVGKWATGLYGKACDQDRDAEILVLTAAGLGEPCEEECFGILADSVDEDVIVRVLRASTGALEEWSDAEWSPVTDEPVGARYRALSGDVLTAALSALNEGHGLVLRAGTPKAFLPKRVPLTAAAGDRDGVYAVVDEVDTSAVMAVFRVAGGEVQSRVDGEWAADPEVLPHVLTAGVPLALVPPPDVPVLLRTVDDHDVVYPVVASDVAPPEDSIPDFSDSVMVALPVDPDVAGQLAVPGGLPPDDMHVTLVYLGKTTDLSVDAAQLASLVVGWAGGVGPFAGEISGPGVFEGTGNADNPAQVALVDVPGLEAARQSLVEALTEARIDVDSSHGFTSHITRRYGAGELDNGIGGVPLSFNTVSVHYGTDRRDIPLGEGVPAADKGADKAKPVKAKPVKANAEPVVADAVAHTRTPGPLQRYWTKGLGAAKIAWSTPGDYRRCLAELGKYVHSSRRLHGQCASLHKLATGIWPAAHAKRERGG